MDRPVREELDLRIMTPATAAKLKDTGVLLARRGPSRLATQVIPGDHHADELPTETAVCRGSIADHRRDEFNYHPVRSLKRGETGVLVPPYPSPRSHQTRASCRYEEATIRAIHRPRVPSPHALLGRYDRAGSVRFRLTTAGSGNQHHQRCGRPGARWPPLRDRFPHLRRVADVLRLVKRSLASLVTRLPAGARRCRSNPRLRWRPPGHPRDR